MSATISTHTTTPSSSPIIPTTYVLTGLTVTAPIVTETLVEKGWHPDPRREHEFRWHDGDAWTEHVTHFGPVPCRACNPGRN